MQRRDLVIGAGVLLVIVGIVLFIQSRRSELSVPEDSSPTPSMSETEQSMEDQFKVNIPDNVEKANLQGLGGSGIATRDVMATPRDVMVLADLPDPETGKFYEAWVSNGTDTKLLGRLASAKGGYLLDANISSSLESYNQVVVSLESVDDNNIEQAVLRGSF